MTYTPFTARSGKLFTRCDDCAGVMPRGSEPVHACPRDSAGTLWVHGTRRTGGPGGAGFESYLTCTRCGEESLGGPVAVRGHKCGSAAWPDVEEAVAAGLSEWAWQQQRAFAVALTERMRGLQAEAMASTDMGDPEDVDALSAYTKAVGDVATTLREMLDGGLTE